MHCNGRCERFNCVRLGMVAFALVFPKTRPENSATKNQPRPNDSHTPDAEAPKVVRDQEKRSIGRREVAREIASRAPSAVPTQYPRGARRAFRAFAEGFGTLPRGTMNSKGFRISQEKLQEFTKTMKVQHSEFVDALSDGTDSIGPRRTRDQMGA